MGIKQIYGKAKEKKVEIVYTEEPEVEVLCDRRWTVEGIFNLLDNGVKYNPPHSVVKVEIKKYGMFAGVTVNDMAEPIPAAEQSKVFQRFFRGIHSKKVEGLGLGLYLTREIAMKQGGYMNLKVNPNGNSFSFFLPVYMQEEKASLTEEKHSVSK